MILLTSGSQCANFNSNKTLKLPSLRNYILCGQSRSFCLCTAQLLPRSSFFPPFCFPTRRHPGRFQCRQHRVLEERGTERIEQHILRHWEVHEGRVLFFESVSRVNRFSKYQVGRGRTCTHLNEWNSSMAPPIFRLIGSDLPTRIVSSSFRLPPSLARTLTYTHLCVLRVRMPRLRPAGRVFSRVFDLYI